MAVMLRRFYPLYLNFRSSISATIDPALNTAIIVVSLLIVVAFIHSGYSPLQARNDQPGRNSNPVGTKVSLQGMDWSKSEQTLLMFLNTHCGFCQKSEPFYRKLSTEATDHQKVRVIAVFPQRIEESKEYLDCAGITVDDVRRPV